MAHINPSPGGWAYSENRILSRKLVILSSVFAGLVILAVRPFGFRTFLNALGHDNIFSLLLVVSAIAVILVMLQRLGLINTHAYVEALTIALLLTSSLLFVLSTNDYSALTLAKAKKLSSSSSSSHITSIPSTKIKVRVSSTKLQHQSKHIPKFGSSFQAISQNLMTAATEDNAITDPNQCNTHLNDFILPAKEARFIILNPCITVSGIVIWTDYFNPDGDANFNVVLDPQYKNMLGPGQYGQEFFLKYHSGAALHVEVPCQGPVTSTIPFNVGACDGYNGPNFKPLLPKMGQHVMVTGRYLIEPPELPGGITEIHSVSSIRILS